MWAGRGSGGPHFRVSALKEFCWAETAGGQRKWEGGQGAFQAGAQHWRAPEPGRRPLSYHGLGLPACCLAGTERCKAAFLVGFLGGWGAGQGAFALSFLGSLAWKWRVLFALVRAVKTKWRQEKL